MKHKYWPMCALAASLSWVQVAKAQPQDANQARAGIPLTAEQQQEFQQKEQAERQKKFEESLAAERRTPAGMLYQFATALNSGNLVLTSRSIEAEVAPGDLRRVSSNLRQGRAWSFQLTPVMAQAPEGKDEFEARVAILPTINDPLELKDDPLLHMRATSIESITLRRGANREWKIVPRPIPATILAATQFFATPSNTAETPEIIEARIKVLQSDADGYLSTWVRALTQPRFLLLNSISGNSMSRVKQILLGMLQFSQDFNEKFDFTPANFVEKLQPYVKSRDIFSAPSLGEDKPFTCTLNPEIAGKSLAAFNEVARTVAIYEADKNGKPLFRFEGKAVIGFVDGHVKLTSPEEAAMLIWKP
jgi:prepilin-type processing-associated H-X9-DG protein